MFGKERADNGSLHHLPLVVLKQIQIINNKYIHRLQKIKEQHVCRIESGIKMNTFKLMLEQLFENKKYTSQGRRSIVAKVHYLMMFNVSVI